MYPIVIFTARYNGVYEGAEWIALNEHADKAAEAQGDDISCMQFFTQYEDFKPIGRGDTPTQAYVDLVAQLEREPEKSWPNR